MFYQATNLNYYTANTSIVITLDSIYNPSAIANIGSIEIKGIYSGTEKTKATVNIPANSFTYDVLRKVSTTLTYQNASLMTLKITMTVPHTGMASDVFHLTFPSDLSMSTLASDYSITGPNTASTPTLTFHSSNSTLTFSPFSLNYISRPSLTVTISNIPRPR